MSLTIGSLCTGYGGLDMAVEQVLDARTAWVSDIDKGACKVLAHRFPHVPNIGDMTAVDWASVEQVDVITGGTPCQDLSHAGQRKGMTEGTRSNLWVAMREAIATIQPSLVIWENVGGAYSAAADSEMESREGRLGDRPSGPVLRALGRVLGDLASLGYVGGWYGLRAADVGAPHGRLRVFVVAVPADQRHEWSWASRDGWAGPADGRLDPVVTLPTPTARDWKNVGDPDKTAARMAERGQPLGEVVVNALLPTPAVNDMGAAYTPDEWDAWTERMKNAHGNGNGHGKSLNIEAQRVTAASYLDRVESMTADPVLLERIQRQRALLPTPSVADVEGGRKARSGDRSNELLLNGIAAEQQWGQYAAAIGRWEALTRPAPAPTETGPKGNPRLSPAFTEWMMGLPDGWITDTPGVTRNEALKLCGNGVVPQQAAAAIRFLLGVIQKQGVAA